MESCSSNRNLTTNCTTDACAAVAPVFLEYEARLKGFVMKRIKDREEANDMLQQLYLKLYKNCEQLQDARHISGWLYQITRNALTDYFREKGKSPFLDADQEIADAPQETQHELEALVLPLLQLLPQEYAEPLRLSELEGMSQKEVAARLGMSYSGAKSRIQRGREKLKQKFMECCHLELDRHGQLLSASIKPDCAPLQEYMS